MILNGLNLKIGVDRGGWRNRLGAAEFAVSAGLRPSRPYGTPDDVVIDFPALKRWATSGSQKRVIGSVRSKSRFAS